jgi:hypothetical protein
MSPGNAERVPANARTISSRFAFSKTCTRSFDEGASSVQCVSL